MIKDAHMIEHRKPHIESLASGHIRIKFIPILRVHHGKTFMITGSQLDCARKPQHLSPQALFLDYNPR